ncbi:translation initiation factor eif-2b subunit alpha-like [Plakobranchus ocellatus]|uniref:Translation initiation factor eIF2B subunit alpha n=1 Tax=Plakobranchus ocellatus TaxID=259542 RepID=A0AAV4DAQ9_9GAST|nr:translation initiation factor eif-2b subunit alpha-like [Plakobranchus ocellatus]
MPDDRAKALLAQQGAVLSHFNGLKRKDPEISDAVAAILTLVKLMESSNAETLSGLVDTIRKATSVMLKTDYSYASIKSGCEQFLRYTTLANLQETNFQKIMLHRGKIFLKNALGARAKIVTTAQQFVDDGITILTHCRSRVVLQVLKAAAMEKKRFTVFITEANPDKNGYLVQEELSKVGIPTTVILDSAIGYIMERVQMVMVGAEGIVENGGSAKVADRSPFKIHRELKSILGDETIEVTKLGSGDLMVELKSNDQAKKLEQSRHSLTSL